MLNKAMVCPVCCWQIPTTCDYMDSFLLKEHATCQCGYSYSYVTGATLETFGAYEFTQYDTGYRNNLKLGNSALNYSMVVWLYRIWWYLKSLRG